MDEYLYRSTFKGIVRRDALAFRQLLGDPMYGDFVHSTLHEDELSADIGPKIERLLRGSAPRDELLLYFIGHGNYTERDGFSFAGVDNKRDVLDGQLTAEALIDWLIEARAQRISVILDCCHSSQLIAALDRRMARRLDLHQRLANAERSIQILVCGRDRVEHGRTALTRSILDGIRTGGAAGARPKCNLEDLEEHALVSGRGLDGTRWFARYGHHRPHIISANPNAGYALPAELLADLHANDTSRRISAVTRLRWISVNEKHRRALADKTLHQFEIQNPNLVPAIRGAFDSWESAPRPERQGRPRLPGTLIIYNTRNQAAAQAARLAFGTQRPRPRLLDLDFARNFQHGDVSLLGWIEKEWPTLWLLDAEATRYLGDRGRDITKAVEAAPTSLGKMSIFWLGAASREAPAIFRTVPRQSSPKAGVAQFVTEILGRAPATDPPPAEGPASDGKSIIRDADLFRRVARAHNDHLIDKQVSATDIAPAELPVLEPNFIVFRQGRSFVLAICDHNAHVATQNLRLSHEPARGARLASQAELKELGFPEIILDGELIRQVDPMFTDPLSRISRIYIDGNIFFQHLMFPRSTVQIPDYSGGVAAPVRLPISNFIRTMQQLHGEEKIVFANIIVRKKDTPKIVETMLAGHFVYTRFAPSPSNSLHIGSLRTAILSYMFSLLGVGRGKFHLRFDDTSTDAATADRNIATILADLAWAGIRCNSHYRQTSPEAQANYNRFFELLTRSGFCEDTGGSAQLKRQRLRVTMNYWLDLKRGPQIRHDAPVYAPNKKLLDYTLTLAKDASSNGNRFLYKFAGAIDDLMHNSLVVRDVRQDHSLFTTRQAVIMSMVREALAYPRDSKCRQLATEIKKVPPHLMANKHNMRPFPFPCPPVYLHVTRVTDRDGQTLSKRALLSVHSLRTIREEALYFPETIVAWCISSFGPAFNVKIGLGDLPTLIGRVVREGPEWFFMSIAERIAFSDLADIPQQDSIPLGALERIERRVIAAMSPSRLNRFAKELCGRWGIQPPPMQDFLVRLYEQRRHFASAGELADTISCWIRDHEKPLRDPLFLTVNVADHSDRTPVGTWVKGTTRRQKASLRFLLLGRHVGPRISALHYVLGPAVFAERIKKGISRYERNTPLSC